MRIADASSVADAVEEFENLNRHLAPAADLVAQPGRERRPVALTEFSNLRGERVDGARGEVVVMRHGVGVATTGDALERLADALLGKRSGLRKFAYARRVLRCGGEQGRQQRP